MLSFAGRIKRAFQGWLLSLFDSPISISKAATSSIIGQSREQADIAVYTFGEGPEHVLFIGGIHGNEVGGIKLMHYLADWLYSNSARFPQLSIHVIPCLNPDGWKLAQDNPDYWNGGKIGRLNSKPVDLNRNFPVSSWEVHAIWSHGPGYENKTEVRGGITPGSEPETQALMEYVNHHKIKTVLACHTAGADVTGSTDRRAQDMAKLYCKRTNFILYTEEMWQALKQTGTCKEWCQDNDISYVEVEGPSRWASDWKNQMPALTAVLGHLNIPPRNDQSK